MPLLYEVFDAIPANNNSDPPLGAPEATTRIKQVNDIIRYLMAAVFEIGEVATGVGTLAAQNANAVAITGGTIANITLTSSSIPAGNNISANALTSGLVPVSRIQVPVADSTRLQSNTAQEFYNGIYPIGSVMFTARERTTIPVPANVVAVWVRYSTNRYIKIEDSDTYTGSELTIETGGATTGVTVFSGEHAHGGSTELHQLSESNLPSHSHPVSRGGSTGGNTTGYVAGGTARNDGAQSTGSIGGDVPHKHDIDSAGTLHTHAYLQNPAYLALTAWRRTA